MYTKETIDFFDQLLNKLYPVRLGKKEFKMDLNEVESMLLSILESSYFPVNSPSNIVGQFISNLTQIKNTLDKDIQATMMGDPAAKSDIEIVLTYPGFYAIAAYRVANQLHKLGISLIPRIITEHAHQKTGIDIHPGATIGDSFCIDHGTGIVIGETTHIGNNVKIYQGVTLGALSTKVQNPTVKRHPTVEDNVVIYAQATILGGSTIIGKNSVIGGNTWITESIPAHSKVTYHHQSIFQKYNQNKL